ncbi:MAG: non-canonical purine NTP pyrophosphatase, partial [Hungatella sp.]
MKRRIIFATGNEGKMREIRLILADPNLEILSMKEAMAEVEIIEDGTTFAENAEIKARAVWKITGGIVMADDSGLVVDYLNGEPGIYSARYLGEDTPYEVKNRVILERLKSAVGDARSARFISAIVAILPDGKALTTQGEV